MPLHFLLEAARQAPLQTISRSNQSQSDSSPLSSDSPLPIIPKDPNLWKQCLHRKQVGDRIYCRQFLSLCATDKCPPKVMKLK